MKVACMTMYRCGDIAAFDDQGEQIHELRVNVTELWIAHATARGCDVNGCRIGFDIYCGTVETNASGDPVVKLRET